MMNVQAIVSLVVFRFLLDRFGKKGARDGSGEERKQVRGSLASREAPSILGHLYIPKQLEQAQRRYSNLGFVNFQKHSLRVL